MRRPASSALPSYTPDETRTADLQSLAPGTPARWNYRWWLLFYAVLGAYAFAVLGSFVFGWAPKHPKQLQLKEQQPQLADHGMDIVQPTANDVLEPLEDWQKLDKEEGEDSATQVTEQVEELRTLRDEDEAPAFDEASVPTAIIDSEPSNAPMRTHEATIVTLTEAAVANAPQMDTEMPKNQKDPVVLVAQHDNMDSGDEADAMLLLKEAEDGDALNETDAVAHIALDAPQEGWTDKDPGQPDSSQRTEEPNLPVSDETRSPVRRSPGFMKALDLVHLPETNPPNPYFHVFPVKSAVTEDAMLVSGMRNSADRNAWTVEGHQQEVGRLENLKNEAKEETERLKLLIGAVEKLVVEEKDILEDKRAVTTLDIRAHQPRMVRKNLKCMGWRQTGQCSPYGKREPNKDLACNQITQGGVSGYCEIMDQDTGELFRTMQLNCSSVRNHVVFSCADAADFANFALMAERVYTDALAHNSTNPSKLLGNTGNGNGIVMVVYPKLLTSVFASISVLRSYNCTLPIELWISQPEVVRTPSMKQTLDMLQRRFSNVSVETIMDPTIAGFSTKIHAVVHSKFENVLFLDADNVPVRDPTYLFESREFRDQGAIFWPDFWHPQKTIFNIQHESLLWELVDLPFVDMFEQESGQILINRKKAALALEVLMFFAYHRPSHFERLVLAHGDKDLFRLAWMKTNAPFYMMPFPPASAGSVRGTFKKQFCGMTMVQFDMNGEVLFLHRNAKKLDGKVDKVDAKYWTHLQTFKWQKSEGVVVGDSEASDEVVFPGARPAVERMISYEDIKQKYQIGIQTSGPLFKEFETCYGAEPNVVDNFNMTLFEDLPFANLEQDLVNYAHEAAVLMAQAENQAQGRLGVH
ncbi:hypothetical protein PHYBOEH_006513 [Phytophthora boehmeriae]|uniref:Nucleotide-diphospho-sugar transferase n=1 Tax=Phytophthora boehmeriae TaxID=109152 RepID=A0A8T1WE87_9STRA|nr:hypothetical protein PHYBOEH_006513 [Phytophthora boehmeriae]